MNINYLLSILDLYLLKENDSPIVIEVADNNEIKVDVSYVRNLPNKTYVKITKEEFFGNIKYFLNKFQGNFEIEKENISDIRDYKVYEVILENQRKISFKKFNVKDLEFIRNNFNNLKNDFRFERIHEPVNANYDALLKKKSSSYQQNFVHQMGFSSFSTIFLTAIWFLDIFLVALWIFKTIR